MPSFLLNFYKPAARSGLSIGMRNVVARNISPSKLFADTVYVSYLQWKLLTLHVRLKLADAIHGSLGALRWELEFEMQ